MEEEVVVELEEDTIVEPKFAIEGVGEEEEAVEEDTGTSGIGVLSGATTIATAGAADEELVGPKYVWPFSKDPSSLVF